MHRRTGEDLDNEALAFKPVLGSMLARIYHNPQIKEENQSKLQQLLQLWASNNIYDPDTITALRNEMIGGESANPFAGPSTAASADLAAGRLLIFHLHFCGELGIFHFMSRVSYVCNIKSGNCLSALDGVLPGGLQLGFSIA